MHPSGDEDGAVCFALAHRVAREYVHHHPLTRPYWDDILSDALYGATMARASYDPAYDTKFTDWALCRARGAVIDGVRERSPFTRGEHARGMTMDNAPPHRQPAVPLDRLIPTQRSPYEQADTRIDLSRMLAHLPPRLLQVLQAYDLDGFTLAEIGRFMGVSESRVCQMRSEALKRARAA